MSNRPHVMTRHVTDVAECTPVVSRAIFSPTCDRDVLPAAIAAAGVSNHHVITAVRQQLNLGGGRVRAIEDAQRGFSIGGAGMCVGELGVM